ncbi:keratin, type I cytoskeletal 19-like [Sceloporus undulatus]|uniref:keratin, type I cytoskeletal 19-like n=1 Tax=Sceloporus undulatus TaxID=8520 RepID=UPI001C4A970A|nr:keratin, type I cytoskeletal 19-like [Sceloporus undulatus]
MTSCAQNIPVTAGRNKTGLGSDGNTRASSISSSHDISCGLLDRGSLSYRSFVGGSSPFGFPNGEGTFSSRSCSGAFIGGGGGCGRRMSTGSCLMGSHGGYPPLGYGDGLVEVCAGGLGGVPLTCGIIFSSTNEKVLMQNLNDRLASYIDKVRCLEEENAALESQIKDFYFKQGLAGELKDYSHYYRQIEELKNQIIRTTLENNKILLKIDNHRMDLDDMRQKFETERGIREMREADVNGLHPVLDELTNFKADLEIALKSLQEELCSLKKTHEKELVFLQKHLHGINMEVSICPGPDLKKTLKEMRHKYEAMIESNRKEVEQWYEGKLVEVNLGVCPSSQKVEDGSHKVMDLKRQLQVLEIDLQAQCNKRDALHMSLAETECRFHTQLAEIQEQISCVEHQLAELHLEMESQDGEYKDLLDIKKRLEQEIQTYRSLLKEWQQNHE